MPRLMYVIGTPYCCFYDYASCIYFTVHRYKRAWKTEKRRGKMSFVLSKPAFCICENKDEDQLRGNREADQRLCFRCIDSTIPLLPKFAISSIYSSFVLVQPGLCRTWSETPKTGFLTTRLKLF